MSEHTIGRRDFLKGCVAGAAAAAGLASCAKKPEGPGPETSSAEPHDAKGLPTRVLGKTGAVVPAIGIGCGSRFCAVEDRETGEAILRTALDHGFYYWDTGYSYGSKTVVSEERLGAVLEGRRREVFLASKTAQRTYDGVMREFEEGLKRLRTDRIDLYQAHTIMNLDDVEAVGAAGGAIEAFHKLRDEKAVRFIGFTGHNSAEAMAEMARRFDFDTMLIALNHYEGEHGDFEKGAIPAAAGKGMGVMIIKAVRPREKAADVSAEDLIRYALSLELVDAAVIGTDSLEVVRKNAEILRSFRKMTPEEMTRVGTVVAAAFGTREFPWMREDYRDGVLG
jgi:aryl-alcohol dehydrogenase-like predicted oxidoreductase